MEIQNLSDDAGDKLMLPPTPGTFHDREELINYVRDFGVTQGYVVTIKKSIRDQRVMLCCDRGGVHRSRHTVAGNKRKRKVASRHTNCPFEALGKKVDDGGWLLTVKNGDHNHAALRDMSEHPYSRRFTKEEVEQIKVMTEAGKKPRQVLKALKEKNPELKSTARHLYNVKAKIRQGNFTDKTFKSWRPKTSASVFTQGESSAKNNRTKVPNLIRGKFMESRACAVVDVVNPATQEVVSQVPLTTYGEFKAAVSAAKKAFPSWRNTPITTRQDIMFKLRELIHRDIDKLVTNITTEQGKTLNGAKGDVLRGLEIVKHACGVETLQTGEIVPNAGNGMNTYCIREPLGVCAGICPFNYPAVIPLWMFPIAVTCGNTFILKPSELNPGASMILAELAMEAGLPDGVLNIVHGTHDIVNHICDDDDIEAISLIGSDIAFQHTYARAAARGKQVQSNLGAKNHAIIMSDASFDTTLDALVAAGFGAAGQRCMTLSTAIFVGGSRKWEDELVGRAKALKVNAGKEPGTDLGPVINKEEKDRICRLVESGVESGARLILDGRNIKVPRYGRGNFVGPTILCDVITSMECYKEEMSGPVLLCMQAGTLEEAIAIVNRQKRGNGAALFTTSGFAATKFQEEVNAAFVGVNVPVPIPIPLPFSSFNGPKASFSGDLNFCVAAKEGVQFYTRRKTVAQQWKELPDRRLPLTSETETISRDLPQVQQPQTSDSDTPNQEFSPVTQLASESDVDSQDFLLCSSPVSEGGNLPNSRSLSSIPPTSYNELRDLGELSGHGVRAAVNQELSQLATDNDLPVLGVSPKTYERIHIPPMFQRADSNIRPMSSESFYIQSPQNALIPNLMSYMPTSYRNDMVQSQRNGKENMYITSAIQRNDGLTLTSERLYLPNATSQGMYRRSPEPLSSEILYMGEYHDGQGGSPTFPMS